MRLQKILAAFAEIYFSGYKDPLYFLDCVAMFLWIPYVAGLLKVLMNSFDD